MPTVKVNQADIGCIGDMLCAALTVNSWTDDLPICRQSGVGFSTNQVYREDGRRQEEHQLEDRSFYFHMDNTFLYGVLDGHNGTQFVDFAIQKFPAEILLGQIRTNMDNNGVKGVKLGNQENTRCLGNCYVKSGYKEFHELKSAIAEPILSDVEIHEPIPLTESCR
ncbi:unnamed protein product [Darwinula stevensoni]|uniref:PPM-type phosphatase domain-containing protein n=1 Tax=Darwinula stevensoni TaxID=69355 RepID=A0A7R9AHB3_9CRUS|nr:unnamed protein product [Darwinula stevensoni]CAG0905156.1 unnamed protein product [Darwinula stevensoni]